MQETKDLQKQNRRLRRQCELQQERLDNYKNLIRINSVINSACNNLDKLLNIIMRTAEKVMHAQTSSLMLIDEQTGELVFQVARGSKGKSIKQKFRLKMGQGIAGWVAKEGKAVVVPDTDKDPRFYSKPDKQSGFKTRSIICVPLKVRNKTIGVLQALNPLRKPSFSRRDLPMFRAFSNIAAVAIENYKVQDYRIRQQRIEDELAIAQKIQENILPQNIPSSSVLRCCAKNLPARMVGGDLYDFIFLKDNHIGVAIGDVSGKGVPAALFMVAMINNLRFFAQTTSDPGEIFTQVNKLLCEESTLGMFVTAAMFMFDLNKKTVSYANAGHLPPLRINQRSTPPLQQWMQGAKEPPLGILPTIKYTTREFPLDEGDMFLLYTDGITEARSSHNNEFGSGRLKKLIGKKAVTPAQVVESIMETVETFSKNVDQHDDITLVCAGYMNHGAGCDNI
ncbi:MAG: SpoIIE family protein phosphatase [Candidatus Auribacterota bacterium]|jgi:sigma-B regulation protein RsbU (phosphoserine phosphatase)|nr:SpoIIE family protein phosphatase [Candidatus Auribacterota bacterium]